MQHTSTNECDMDICLNAFKNDMENQSIMNF